MDPLDTLDFERKVVRLSKDQRQKMEAGIIIARQMTRIRDKTVDKYPNIRPFFILDPTVNGLENSLKKEAKDFNWNTINREL